MTLHPPSVSCDTPANPLLPPPFSSLHRRDCHASEEEGGVTHTQKYLDLSVGRVLRRVIKADRDVLELWEGPVGQLVI